MRTILRALALSVLFFMFAVPVSATAHCEFRLGFATLRDLIGHETVGECLENEHYNAIGDSNQQTTGGLMAWRKADNWTAFTDGYRTWINGPNGLVQRLNTERFDWEADYEAVTAPQPVATPEPVPVAPTPAPQSISISGSGRRATDTVSVPFPVAVIALRHTGRSNFIVYSYQGDSRELLVNEIGAYVGKSYLLQGEYLFDIRADGAWSLDILPLDSDQSVAQSGFSGSSDDVSGFFTPPSTGAWSLSHSGDSNFIVYLHCAGGSDLLANEIGALSGSSIIRFPEGPCFFEVKANGAFSVMPR